MPAGDQPSMNRRRVATAQGDVARRLEALMPLIAHVQVADVPGRVQLSVEPVAGDTVGAVNLQVRVRDEKYQPLDDATVTLDFALARLTDVIDRLVVYPAQ